MYIQVVDANLVNNPIWSLFYLVFVLFLYYDGCYETVGFYIHKKSTILRLLIPSFFPTRGLISPSNFLTYTQAMIITSNCLLYRKRLPLLA